MLCKLAFRNVARSIRDFTVYFLTLAFGVCLFYVFNSIDAQQAMIALSDSQKFYVAQMTEIMAYVSVFVAVVFGLLVVYANRFLMKRRKRELGMYLLLGMERGGISRILIAETFLIGLFALAAGLTAGVFLSQIVSVFTARLFEADLTSFHFILSPEAVGKTVLCFAVIFAVVIVFNMVSVSRCRLSELLTAGRKNESSGVRGGRVSLILFLLSVLSLGAAYVWVLHTGLFSAELGKQIVLGCVGTVLFFFSLSGFLSALPRLFPRFYFRGLNCFVLRQVNARVNTAALSMSVICLMLFLTISALAGGVSTSEGFSTQARANNPYSASLLYYVDQGAKPSLNMEQQLRADGVPYDEFVRSSSQMEIHTAEVVFEDGLHFFLEVGLPEEEGPFRKQGNSVFAPFCDVLAESEWNAMRRLANQPEVSVEEGEYLLWVEPAVAQELGSFYTSGLAVTVEGETFFPAQEACVSEPLSTGVNSIDILAVILPDEAAEKLPVLAELLNIQLLDGVKEEDFVEVLDEIYTRPREDMEKNWRPYDQKITRQSVMNSSIGAKTIVLFLGIYIGLVFLITSAAVLGLQQLSETADCAENYRLLRRLGAKEKAVRRALFAQIAMYVCLPLALALIHSAVGLEVLRRTFASEMAIDILPGALATAGILLLIYGGYLFATCFSAQGIIRSRRGE